MSRFNALILELENAYPGDGWLKRYRLLPEVDDVGIFNSKISVYDRALNSLDEAAWNSLKEKIFGLFKQDHTRRGKSAFFDQMNEAFAYELLKRLGGSRITFVPEQSVSGKKTPDLSFELNGEPGLCEVKTISYSDEELNRHNQEQIVSSEVYVELDAGFFNKLTSVIDNASKKFWMNGGRSVIYVIVHFDDPTQMYFSTYRRQTLEFIALKFPQFEFYFQIGLDGTNDFHYEVNYA